MLAMTNTATSIRPFAILCAMTLTVGIAGCSTAQSENLSAAQCEELREEKRSRQSDNTLSAQDLEDLRVQGC